MNEKEIDSSRTAFTWPRWNKKSVCQYLLVFAMAGVGVAMMMAGLMAWVVGEQVLLMAGVTGGSVFVAAGGMGLLRCLDASVPR